MLTRIGLCVLGLKPLGSEVSFIGRISVPFTWWLLLYVTSCHLSPIPTPPFHFLPPLLFPPASSHPSHLLLL